MNLNKRGLLNFVLLPISLIYFILVTIRRFSYTLGLRKIYHFKKTIIVVGNITVGGTGKTPLVIAIAKFLQQNDFKVGVVSRGYGGRGNSKKSISVAKFSSYKKVGDEPVMIANNLNIPIMINKKRAVAVADLLKNNTIDIVISDDGLQHYSMARDIEIAVIDGKLRFANNWFLPAGPLREPISRLSKCDFIINNSGKTYSNEFAMTLKPVEYINIKTNKKIAFNDWNIRNCNAICAIGNPDRFFSVLEHQGIKLEKKIFKDHYPFKITDINFNNDKPIIMTEKDAVKCRKFANEKMYYLKVETKLDAKFLTKLLEKL